MAYVDFSQAALVAGGAQAMPADRSGEATGFSALEWLVVALAGRDRLTSLREPGRLALALGRLFGGERNAARLADPRLEALRRVAVHAWHVGYNVPASELAAFVAAGFSSEQVEQLLAHIVGRRAVQRSRARQG